MKLIHQAWGETAYADCYLQANSEEINPELKRPLVVICPGGGYGFTSDREAEPVALNFLAAGVQAVVLRYSAGGQHRFPEALVELAKTLRWVRQNAQAWQVDPAKVLVLGFSAGGHLALSLGCFWQADWLLAHGFSATEIQPNGLILAYPVVSAGQFAHQGSVDNLLGDAPDAATLALQSLQNQVDTQLPPVFLWSTVTDQAVPVENTLMLVNALQKHRCDYELHLFPEGGHGLSLGTEQTANTKTGFGVNPVVAQWWPLCQRWLSDKFLD